MRVETKQGGAKAPDRFSETALEANASALS